MRNRNPFVPGRQRWADMDKCDRCLRPENCTRCFDDMVGGQVTYQHYVSDGISVLALWLCLFCLLIFSSTVRTELATRASLIWLGLSLVFGGISFGWYMLAQRKPKKKSPADVGASDGAGS